MYNTLEEEDEEEEQEKESMDGAVHSYICQLRLV